MTIFKDNFSKQSDLYVKYRPLYPPELFAYLASLTKEHHTVWDCGTGNGQAAVGLAEFYDKIIATDPSEQQIKNAMPNKKVIYRVEKAENSSVESNSIDLLTVANALHWFDFDVFYKEANRVLKNNGIIAAWCYTIPSVSPEIDKMIRHFNDVVIDDYWQAENRLVEKEYATIPFPFQEFQNPSFYYEKTMNLNDVIGYLNTWSATQRFIDQNKFNPTEQFKNDLLKIWGDPDAVKKLRWNLALKVGKIV